MTISVPQGILDRIKTIADEIQRLDMYDRADREAIAEHEKLIQDRHQARLGLLNARSELELANNIWFAHLSPLKEPIKLGVWDGSHPPTGPTTVHDEAPSVTAQEGSPLFTPHQAKVVGAMTGSPERAAQIAGRMGSTAKAIGPILSSLRSRGVIERTEEGWALTAFGDAS